MLRAAGNRTQYPRRKMFEAKRKPNRSWCQLNTDHFDFVPIGFFYHYLRAESVDGITVYAENRFSIFF